MKKYNVLYVFADQWRAEAFSYNGNPDVKTPFIDGFSSKAINVSNSISTCPVCSPYRASLLTGTYPLHNGIFTNDATINPEFIGMGDAFKKAGYQTAYIGKWHIHGEGRSSYIPPEHRFGFDYWKVLECTHDYMDSKYYAQDEKDLKTWDGYDADAQTDDLVHYICEEKDKYKPFCAFLSWGPPHAPPPYEKDSPYGSYPADLEGLYDSDELTLRGNVPEEDEERTRKLLKGYYSHCTALDRNFGKILKTLEETGLMDKTIVVFTSDHGDAMGSQGLYKKQNPFIESINTPFLIHIPHQGNKKIDNLILGLEDIMPTLLSLCEIPVPEEVEGIDCSRILKGDKTESKESELFALYVACGQWRKGQDGGVNGLTGREYRGLKTRQYTYVITLEGPWLLFDDLNDPEQMNNLINDSSFSEIQNELDEILSNKMRERNDLFKDGEAYNLLWNYKTGKDFEIIFNE